MRTACATLLLCTALGLGAQTPFITEVQRMPGERQLHLQGLFVDADTVLVQVYHDSDVLTEEVRAHTWSLVLGTFESYTVKFTDGTGRVKRLYVVELSDDQLEFVPPIEVDFGVAGNLVLLKQRDRQPDFTLYNVGTSRKR